MNKQELGSKIPSRALGYWQRIPREIIDDVHVNRQLTNTSDQHVLDLMDEERMVDYAAVFAFGREQGEVKRIQPPSMLRGNVVEYGLFQDEYGVHYGQVALKGTGLTPRGVQERFIDGDSYQGDPHGFFGDRDAADETRVSNDFASYGGRNGRVMGTVTLDPGRFGAWLQDNEWMYPAAKMNDIVVANGDKPAILVRLLGAERTVDYNKAEPGTFFSNENNLKRAARLIKEDIDYLSPAGFSSRYDYDVSSLSAAVDSIVEGGARRKLDRYTFTQAISYLQGRNMGVYYNLSHDRYNSKLNKNIGFQDLDSAGFWYDWEGTPENDRNKNVANGRVFMFERILGAQYGLFRSLNNGESSPAVRGTIRASAHQGLKSAISPSLAHLV